MARRQRFLFTDFFALVLTGSGKSNQTQSDFGSSIATAVGSDLIGATVGPFWARWYVVDSDTGTDSGGVAWGVRMGNEDMDAVDQPTVADHAGRYALHDAQHVLEAGTANNVAHPWRGGPSTRIESKSKVRVPRIEDTLWVVGGQESALNIQIKIALTVLVLLP